MGVARPNRVLLALSVCGVSFAYLARGIHVSATSGDSPHFHPDEAHKLAEGFFYHLFLEQRAPDHPAWTQDFFARTNPTVGKYVFGAALAAGGHHVPNLELQHHFSKRWKRPDELRKHVPDDMLRITRYTSALYGSLTCMLLFLIGSRVGGVAAGLIASLLLLAWPPFQVYARRGMGDTILMCHVTLIVPVSLWAVTTLGRYWQTGALDARIRRWCAACVAAVLSPGLVIALAAGTKLIGAVTALAHAASVLFVALLPGRDKPRWRPIGFSLFVICLATILGLATFLALNPYLYHDPVARVADMMRTYRDWVIALQIVPGTGLFTVLQRYSAVGHFSLHSPLLPLPRYLGKPGVWLTVLGFAFGIVYLVGRCFPPRRLDRDHAAEHSKENERRAEGVAVLSWIVACAGGITLALPLLWDRYLLIPYEAVSLTTAIGLAALPGALRSAIRLREGRIVRRRTHRLITGASCTVMVALVLGFTHWVIQPALLNPKALGVGARQGHYQEYVAAVSAKPHSPIFRHHLGLAQLQRGMNLKAVQQFEIALTLLPADRSDRPSVVVQRACFLFDLALARYAARNRSGAVDALQQHIDAVAELRDGMKSTDPGVRAVFNGIIANRRKLPGTVS
jgi:hypothetical protein